jgi:uncharacterized protein
MMSIVKTLFLTVFLSTILFLSKAQQTSMEKSPIKSIEVTGSAEQEVVPDEICLTISLKEYFKDKENKNRVNIMILEKQLQKAVEEAGITKDNFTIGSLAGAQEWFGKKKPTTFLESKNYNLKVSNFSKIDGIIAKVDEKGVSYVNIDRFEYSKSETLKKEIKIKALQAAKDKAKYLLEAINEQIGEAIQIIEIENGYLPGPMYSSMSNAKMVNTSADMPESNIEAQKIKIKYEMKAVFRIK